MCVWTQCRVMRSQSDLMQGIAPIFGHDLSCFISGGAHIRLPLAGFGSKLLDGFSLLIDLQPEGNAPSVLLGTGVSGKTSLLIHYHEGGVKNRIRCDVRDDNGRVLSGKAQLSKDAAKRLFISADLRLQKIQVSEFTIHSFRTAVPVEYLAGDNPTSFSDFSYDMLLGGACIDGNRLGSVSTKIARFLLLNRALSQDEICSLGETSRRELNAFYGKHAYHVDESAERRKVFQDDMNKLRKWSQKTTDLADHPGKPADAEAIWEAALNADKVKAEIRNDQDHQSDPRGVLGAAGRGEGSRTGLQQR